MRTSNPIFRSVENTESKTYSNAASYFGISIKTGILFLTIVLSGIFANYLLKNNVEALATILAVSGITALISVIIATIFVRVAMPFSILYAAAEGIALGTLTILLDSMFPGIALTAITATIVIFGIMLMLYSFRVIRVTQRFRKMMYAILLGILVFSILAAIIAPIRTLFSQNAGLAILLSLFIIGYGAFMLMLDFDRAEMIVSNGADKKYEWTVALGLTITIIWIYVEILRLIVILKGRDN